MTDLGSNKCSYGYFYTRNDSEIPLKMSFNTAECIGFVKLVNQEKYQFSLEKG